VIERISTPAGKVLYARRRQPLGRIVEPQYIGMMNAMLQQTLESGTAHNASLPGWEAAGKTGTSQDFRDAWFIGFTANLVTGVWLGNDDGAPTKRVTGGGMPVAIWSAFMRNAEQGVVASALPGTSGSGLFSRLGPFAEAAPTPPAAVSANAPPQRRGLDGWLLDNLFGRR
jgi:penicillin-binding protein 1A